MAFTFVDSDLLATLDDCRSIAGDMGLHPFTVTVRTVTWSGASVGAGTPTITNVPLTVAGGQSPKVSQVKGSDIARSGGVLEAGQFKIGPMTPPYAGGGVTDATLEPAMAVQPTELYFLVKGPGQPTVGQWCTKVQDESDSSLHRYLYLEICAVQNPGGST